MTSPRKGVAVAFAAALGATLVLALPVVLAPTARLFGSRESFAREDPNRDPLIVIEQLRTGRVPGPYLQPLTDLPGRALARLVGPVAAYNVLVLATFPLSAAAAYLLARHVVGSHVGAMVAGLAYAWLVGLHTKLEVELLGVVLGVAGASFPRGRNTPRPPRCPIRGRRE